MKRLLILALLFSCPEWGQLKPRQQPQQKEQEPPEEDESVAPKEYAFNPLQATKEVEIGRYYFKKKNYRAAAKRFTEATKWNPTFADAFLLLGETDEKLRDKAGAQQAFGKYLELQPDAKNAAEIKKKLTGKR
jgi:tetratricopeptide (TPR) repeat protein